jgi:hypothetical protein
MYKPQGGEHPRCRYLERRNGNFLGPPRHSNGAEAGIFWNLLLLKVSNSNGGRVVLGMYHTPEVSDFLGTNVPTRYPGTWRPPVFDFSLLVFGQGAAQCQTAALLNIQTVVERHGR